MYCSKCGSLMSATLNYCKNCGARLSKNADEKGTSGAILDNILTTVCVVVVFGLGFLVGLVAVLLNKNVADKVVIMLSLFYLAALSGICYSLLSQVPKLIDAKLKEKNSPEADYAEPFRLAAPTTAQLEEHREPAVSVTENTTRTFEKIPLKDH